MKGCDSVHQECHAGIGVVRLEGGGTTRPETADGPGLAWHGTAHRQQAQRLITTLTKGVRIAGEERLFITPSAIQVDFFVRRRW